MKAAQARLPKIGDVRWERPTADATSGHFMPKEPQRCTVVYVHTEHLWYTVQFESGARESYKVPRTKSAGGDDDV
jgi:hypothetical protein